MAAIYPAGIVIAAILFPVVMVVSSFPATLTLERGIPPIHKVELSHLLHRDSIRHGRILQNIDGVVSFPVVGTFNPYVVGLYFTHVQLGSPAKQYNVQIDTGSDVMWVSCSSCNSCPVSSGLDVQLSFYDPKDSSTASSMSCSDKRCSVGIQSSESICGANTNQCSYSFQYGDGSGASGYYVSDMFRMAVLDETSVNYTSAPVVFGCATSVTGDLTKTERAIDGIFGFGRQGMSVISQLASQGLTPNIFSHCLNGDDSGGGVLVIGEVVEPNIVYTPLVPSMPHYNLNLESISVGGKNLPVNPSVFATSSTTGTIVDSGTTLAYLAQSAYDPFISAITSAAGQSVRAFVMKQSQCYSVPTSTQQIFPLVSFNFAGGTSMILKPQDYLIPQTVDGTQMWCVGFQKAQGQEITILGDLVLKDKIVIYDIENQRIGWTPYDCAMPVNVSATITNRKSETLNSKEYSGASSPAEIPRKLLIQITTITLLIHMFTLGNRRFL